MSELSDSISRLFSTMLSRLLKVPGADGVLVRWGMVCIVAILLWVLLLDPWGQTLQKQRDMLSSRSMEVARLKQLQLQAGAWAKSERQFGKAMQAASKALLQQHSATAAQSELGQLLQGIALQQRLKLESQHFMPVADQPGLGKRVAIEMRLLGSMADAYRFLDKLGHQQRLLMIEKLNIGRRSTGEMGMFIQVAGFMAEPGAG